MSLLRRKRNRKRVRLRPYTTQPCPVNGHQVSWCRGLCDPIDGMGLCGRPAPHMLTGRTQAAIAAWIARNVRQQ